MNLLIAFQFFRRDLHIYKKRLLRYMVQYAIVYPTLFGICWAYLVPAAGSAAQTAAPTIIFVGTLLFAFSAFAFAIVADFLFDFEQERFIDYQLIVLPVWLIVAQKIVFNGLFIFVGLLPFIPFSKLIFSYLINLPYVSWVGTIAMLFASSFFFASFQVAFACYTKGTGQIRHFWRRVNYPLSMLGGFLIPWKVLLGFSPVVGSCMLLNPYLYVTEGLRNAILGGHQFFPWSLCVTVLFGATMLCFFGSIKFLKRKVDAL